MDIGVLGATGPAGKGLAARLASLGHDVVAGSRDANRSADAVTALTDRWGARLATLRPGTNDDAAAAADLVVLATTWEGSVATAAAHADALAAKIVIAMANGLEKVGDEFRVVLPDDRSLAEGVQAAAPGARVVSAFHLVPAAAFAALDVPLTSDIIVCSDDRAAAGVVRGLVTAMPNLRAFDGGSLRNSLGLEAFTAVLMTVNVRQRGKASLLLSGVEPSDPG
jgi:8-hydroxy-5-deazaflavin:NADPH oxidoreductase